MARAKSTERAEARRRHRAAQAAADGGATEATDIEEPAPVAEQPRGPLFRPPNVRADVAALPGILRTRRGIWLAFALMPLALLVWFAVPRDGDPTLVFVADTLLQLSLLPQATVPTFIAGFVTPRAAYLVGLLLGLVNAGLILAAAPAIAQRAAGAQDAELGPIALLVVVTDTVLCAFASWYRRFLRTTQERQRAQREARIREQKRQQRTAGRRPGAKGAKGATR